MKLCGYGVQGEYILNRGNVLPIQYLNININKKCLLISIQVTQTIVTEFTIFNF